MQIVYIKQRGSEERLEGVTGYQITWENSEVDRVIKKGEDWFSDSGLSSWDATAIGYLIETWD